MTSATERMLRVEGICGLHFEPALQVLSRKQRNSGVNGY